jgi:hypothetical protein
MESQVCSKCDAACSFATAAPRPPAVYCVNAAQTPRKRPLQHPFAPGFPLFSDFLAYHNESLLQNREVLAGHNFANIASSGSARSSAKF